MVIVDAIDEKASEFYAARGFLRLPESPRLVLPMRIVCRRSTTPITACNGFSNASLGPYTD